MPDPILLSTWHFGLPANKAGWPHLLKAGGLLDALEQTCVACELDPAVDSVGVGGLPDASGEVSLDGAVMLSPARSAGVAYVRRYAHPVSIARRLMEKTPHKLLVGEGAERFAASEGFATAELLTNRAHEKWEAWRATGAHLDFHVGEREASDPEVRKALDESHDTIGVLGLDASGKIGVACSTSGRAFKLPGRVGAGFGPGQWAAYAGAGALGLFGFGGLARGRTGRAWVLGLFGRYRGTVRRTGLMWVNPLVLRRRVDVRLRHWRSEPMSVVDANGVELRVVVLVVWRVKDTARAVLAVDDHRTYLRECVEAALSRVLSQVPAELPPAVIRDLTLRNTDAVGEALTRMVAADTAPVGLEVFSAQPTRIEYAPEIAAVMQRRRIAALDAQYRDSVLGSVVDSVEDTVTRLTLRGLVELDDYERKALVKDLTVAFCTGRGEMAP